MEHTKTQAEVEERCWPWAEKLAPCQNSCPVHMDIPGYIIAVALGKLDEAAAIIRESIPFPAVCGHVCDHPCEEVCLRGKIDEPIAIRAIKRFVSEYELSRGTAKPTLPETREEKVAIIGSGPAGLTAAHDLARKGYQVTVFEAFSTPGGMLAVGIPEFVLPRRMLKADLEFIESLGVEIKTGTSLGKGFSLEDLSKQGYKAVFLAMGMPKNVKLNIPGIDIEGVIYALPFLQDVNLGKEVKIPGKVIVIGGGNVGVDCARAAVRLGAEVHIACLESREEMPAFKWEIENAEKEGVNIHCSLSPQRIIAKDGKISGINFTGVKSIQFDSEGRIKPVLIERKEEEIQGEGVIIAIGQASDPSFLEGAKGLQLDRRGIIKVDSVTLATSLPGVFAGGDAAGKRAAVIDAIASGKEAAISIERYLRGKDLREGREVEAKVLEVVEEKLPKFVERRGRKEMPSLSTGERVRTSKEVELGFSEEEAKEEAKRCLNCPICGNCIFDRSQMCHETALRLL